MPSDFPPELAHALAGRFVVVDGPDGSGKSTQFHRLVEAAKAAKLPVCDVREPGGTRLGEAIRTILLDPNHTEMDIRTEMLLYMASRAQLINERILPALRARHFVLADRYVSSTLAYQGTAGGLDHAEIHAAARVACAIRPDPDAPAHELTPDLTLLFDVDEATAARRLNPLLDRMEQKGRDFHKRVRLGYLQQAAERPDTWAVIDASKPEHEVAAAVIGTLHERFV